MEYAVILVDSTSHALRIEKLLLNQHFVCKLIPVPRHLSSDCGVCVRVARNDMDTIKTILDENKVSYQSIEAV
jgi:hypothetical protein